MPEARCAIGRVDDVAVHHCEYDSCLVNRVRIGFKNILIEYNEVSLLAYFDGSDLVFHVQLVGGIDREAPDQALHAKTLRLARLD